MRLAAVSLAIAVVLATGAAQLAPPSAPQNSPSVLPAAGDSDLLVALRAKIKGRESEPAEAVFTNIQTLKGKPAAAILSIMDIGYNTSLGVSCSYCHDPRDWASDSKSEKLVARQMSAMVHDINEKYLPAIKGLKSDSPVVNCTTCHRGHEKPALNLEPAPAAGH